MDLGTAWLGTEAGAVVGLAVNNELAADGCAQATPVRNVLLTSNAFGSAGLLAAGVNCVDEDAERVELLDGPGMDLTGTACKTAFLEGAGAACREPPGVH